MMLDAHRFKMDLVKLLRNTLHAEIKPSACNASFRACLTHGVQ